MRRIFFYAQDNTELVGLLEEPEIKTDKIVISIHGMQSSCLKEREDILASNITKAGYAYFSFNNRGSGLIQFLSKKNENRELAGGAAFEDVQESYFDIVGAINKMCELGYSQIYLQGHSLGCTKIIYTYNKLLREKESEKILNHIKGIMLLSLVDIPKTQEYDQGIEKFKKYLAYAEELEKQGKDKELMPEEAFMNMISVKTYLRYFKYNKEIDFARYSDKEYNFDKINNIDIPLFLRWGNVNEFIVQDINDLISNLKEKLTNKNLDIGYIDGADHGYHPHEEKLAEEIIKFLKQNLN